MDPLCDAHRFFVQRALLVGLWCPQGGDFGGGGWKWAQVLCTPPDRKVVGAGPVGSGHGSYQ